MLSVVEPRHLAAVLEVCERWELTASVIGEVTDATTVEVSSAGEVVADVPAPALADEGPVYNRAMERPGWIDELQAADPGGGAPESLAGALMDLLGAPDVCSKQWVWEQYDHMIFLGTVQGPGADATVIRLPDREEAVAISVDGPGRLCYLDPYRGATAAVAEAARNVACTGARPLAVTNCLNFGNPEKPEVMWSFAEAVRGVADAARALGTPVTGGNVSFYNETSGRAIYPTPVIGMLGALDSARRAVGLGWTADDDAIVLIGRTDPSHFAGSQYAKVVHGIVAGRPPEVDLDAERALMRLLVGHPDLLHSAHDLSDGGLGVALAEASISGGRGFSIDLPPGAPHEVLFSESPTRVVVSCALESVDRLLDRVAELRLCASVLGRTGGDVLDFGALSIPLKDGIARWTAALPSALSDSISH
jgi:phosphoribosylformylglycinamidine synthase